MFSLFNMLPFQKAEEAAQPLRIAPVATPLARTWMSPGSEFLQVVLTPSQSDVGRCGVCTCMYAKTGSVKMRYLVLRFKELWVSGGSSSPLPCLSLPPGVEVVSLFTSFSLSIHKCVILI